MIFNSLEFAIFLPLVFLVYWFVVNKNLRLQNSFLILASYFFYGWWDWRFLSLIFISTIVDYSVGIGLSKTEDKNRRKLLLFLSVLINIGFLGFFKYFNFFSESFSDAFILFGKSFEPSRLKIILPVGISFYTFQTLSYSIDVYRKKMKPTKDIIAFFAFVSFFPQLVAGPIERATNLLPQFFSKREFDYQTASNGMRQILWGLFKKVVIADNCAPIVNDIFSNYQHHSGSTLFLGAALFAFQIYGDFSGYSDIAIGTSRLFGFDLKKNFAYPYFSIDIKIFWTRWHISLTTWFRDYIFLPIAFPLSRITDKYRFLKINPDLVTYIVTLSITWFLTGLWHGANYTFILWGVIHCIYLIIFRISKKHRKKLLKLTKIDSKNALLILFETIFTFTIVSIAWIFFRAENVLQAFNYLSIICSSSLFTIPGIIPKKVIISILFLLVIEWIGRKEDFAIAPLVRIKYSPIRYAFYYVLVFSILNSFGKGQDFIYFQF